jgi:hypothetical protein
MGDKGELQSFSDAEAMGIRVGRVQRTRFVTRDA